MQISLLIKWKRKKCDKKIEKVIFMFYVGMVMRIDWRLIMLYMVPEERYIDTYWTSDINQKKHNMIRDG